MAKAQGEIEIMTTRQIDADDHFPFPCLNFTLRLYNSYLMFQFHPKALPKLLGYAPNERREYNWL